MSQNDDYTGFIQHNGYVIGVLGAFAVFTFGAICLIITVIPDPSKLHIQSTLLFLSVLFYSALYLLGDGLTRNLSLCRKRSVYDRHDVMYNIGVFSLFYMFGLMILLIFMVWSLYVLSGVCAIIYIIMGMAAARFIINPLLVQRKLDRRRTAELSRRDHGDEHHVNDEPTSFKPLYHHTPAQQHHGSLFVKSRQQDLSFVEMQIPS